MKTKLTSLLFTIFLLFYFSCGFCERDPSYIVIYGDSRTNHAVHKDIVKAIMKYKPSVVFHTGDLVTNNPDEWKTVNKIISVLKETSDFYPALGNHEYYAGVESFFSNFELPNNEQWYSVERHGIHFIILNSTVSIDKDSDQYKWLETDLKNINSNIKFIIVIFHHPPFSSSYNLAGNEETFRNIAVPLFKKYGVDIVFNGHTHAYERCLYNNIYYITTGGGGAPLHDKRQKCPYSRKFVKTHHFCVLYVKGNRLFVEVLGKDLKVLDRFYIRGR